MTFIAIVLLFGFSSILDVIDPGHTTLWFAPLGGSGLILWAFLFFLCLWGDFNRAFHRGK